MTLQDFFQRHLAVADLQCNLPGNYLTTAAAPPPTMYVAPFKLMRLPSSALHTTLTRLLGGAANADSSSDDNVDDAANLRLDTHTNTIVSEPLLPSPYATPAPRGGGGGGGEGRGGGGGGRGDPYTATLPLPPKPPGTRTRGVG